MYRVQSANSAVGQRGILVKPKSDFASIPPQPLARDWTLITIPGLLSPFLFERLYLVPDENFMDGCQAEIGSMVPLALIVYSPGAHFSF